MIFFQFRAQNLLGRLFCCISITFSTLSSNSRYSFADQHRFGHFHADSSLPRPVSSTRSSFRGHGKEAFRSILLLPPLALQCFFHLSIKISILLESKQIFFQSSSIQLFKANVNEPITNSEENRPKAVLPKHNLGVKESGCDNEVFKDPPPRPTSAMSDAFQAPAADAYSGKVTN